MLIVPSILQTYQSLKDKTLKLVFETNEPTPEQLVAIVNNVQKFGWLAFKENQYKEKELEVLNSLKSDLNTEGKSKSQRLRAVLYRNWEQKNEGYEVFDDYYNSNMERLIIKFKNKLE